MAPPPCERTEILMLLKFTTGTIFAGSVSEDEHSGESPNAFPPVHYTLRCVTSCYVLLRSLTREMLYGRETGLRHKG